MPAMHATSSTSAVRSPRPKLCSGDLPSAQLGSEVLLVTVLPGAALLPHQQLPVVVGKASHQKSVPLGFTVPSGATPIVLPLMLLRYDVDRPVSVHPGIG